MECRSPFGCLAVVLPVLRIRCAEINLSLSLCFRRDRNSPYVNSVKISLTPLPLTSVVQRAYFQYCNVDDQNKSWSSKFNVLVNHKGCSIPFAVPMVWSKPTNHLTNCYLCVVFPIHRGITKMKKWALEYPNIPSAIRPMPHGEGVPKPEPPSPGHIPLYSREEENTHEKTLQQSASIDL